MTQSTWTAVSDRIVAQVRTVANIGRVHDRTRLLFTEEDFLAHAYADIGAEKALRMWMTHLETGRDSIWEEAGGTYRWDRLAVLEGFLQLNDADGSERTAIALGETVIRVLNTDVRTTKLGGTVLAGGPATFPAGARPGEPRQFGFVFCNYIRIELPLLTCES